MKRWLFAVSLSAGMMAGPAAFAASKCVSGTHTPPYRIGWANIYSVPTWMKQTQGTMEKIVAQLKAKHLVAGLKITDAQGNASTQIQQIQSMIDAKMDAIVIDAGSATALDRVIAEACSKGIAVVNFDSLVNTTDLTAKVGTDQIAWGREAAQWLAGKLHGKGNIIVLNGPAGVSVSDDRRKGALAVVKADPGMKIVAETNTDYNTAPAQQAVNNLLFSHPKIDGVLSLGGALSAGAVLAFQHQGRAFVPITGENYKQFLALWKKDKLTGWATMQPNWLGALGIYTAVEALQGKTVPAFVKVPLPVITNANLDSYLARGKNFPADGYVYSPYSIAMFDKLLKQ